VYPDPAAVPPAVLATVPPDRARDYYAEQPASDEIFDVYKERFSYDPGELNARVEWTRNADSWIHEKVSFDAPYGGERIIAHLFLPRNASPPYQTVIYFPGSASLFQESSEQIEQYYEYPIFLSFLVKSGRAVLYPIYKGTFERRDLSLARYHMGDPSHRYAEFLVQLVKDFRRSVDYLESRTDIDSDRLAFYGMSWGGVVAPVITSVEDRLEASVVLSGGVPASFATGEVAEFRPEADPLNYLPRVTVPTVMINGRYDMILPLEQSIRPMFDLLGTPEDRKKLLLYDTDHIPPRNEFIKESLAWLDRWLGSVNHSVKE
jgi:dipeptidyl aminopeptidase/acylaminoacyl peptidase